MSEAIKLYPLAASQKMHYYTVQYCPKKEVLIDEFDTSALKLFKVMV